MTNSWRDNASCAYLDQPELWFPISSREEEAEAAMRICWQCPVQAECAADVLDDIECGRSTIGTIRGGVYLPAHPSTAAYRTAVSHLREIAATLGDRA